MVLMACKSSILISGYKQILVRVQYRPLLENELLDIPVEQFLASLRFEHREKLDKLGIEKGTFEWKTVIIGSRPVNDN